VGSGAAMVNIFFFFSVFTKSERDVGSGGGGGGWVGSWKAGFAWVLGSAFFLELSTE